MKTTFFTILLIAFLSFNLWAQSEITEEEYEVYGSQVHSLVLNKTEVPDLSIDDKMLKKWLPKRIKGIFQDFINKNSKSYQIDKKRLLYCQ